MWRECGCVHIACGCKHVLNISYAIEPQLRIRDFCLSLSELSELRRALICPSQDGQL